MRERGLIPVVGAQLSEWISQVRRVPGLSSTSVRAKTHRNHRHLPGGAPGVGGILRSPPEVLPVCALMGAVLDPHQGKHENAARRSLAAASRTVVQAEGLGGVSSDFHQVRLPVPNVVIGRRLIVASTGGHRRAFSLPSYCSCQSGER